MYTSRVYFAILKMIHVQRITIEIVRPAVVIGIMSRRHNRRPMFYFGQYLLCVRHSSLFARFKNSGRMTHIVFLILRHRPSDKLFRNAMQSSFFYQNLMTRTNRIVPNFRNFPDS